MKDLIYLGIDIGTTNTKALVLGQNGIILDLIKIQTPKKFENDVEFLDLSKLEFQIDTILNDINEKYNVQGIAFSSFGESVVPTKGNSFTHEPLMWYDECTINIMKELEPFVEKHVPYKVSGLKRGYTYSIYKILWMKKNLIFEEPDFWLPLSSYFTYKYTGKAIWDMTHACRTLLFDIHNRVWINELTNLLNLQGKLGELAYTGTLVGNNKEGIPIFLSGHDHFTGLFGISKILNTESIIYDSMGSASVIAAIAYEKENELHFEEPFMKPSGIIGTAFQDKQYYLENSIKYYGKFLEWIMQLIGIIPNSENFIKINEEIENNKMIKEKMYFLVGGDIISGEDKARFNILNCPINISNWEIIQSAYIYLCTMSKIIYDNLKKFLPQEFIYVASGGNTLNKTFMEYKTTLLDKNIFIINTSETTALGSCIAGIIGSRNDSALNNLRSNLKVEKTVAIPEKKNELYNSFNRISAFYESLLTIDLHTILE